MYQFLKKVDFSPYQEDLKEIKKAASWINSSLNASLKSSKLGAQVFLGGSYAKGTMIQSDLYDIDVFIRCKKESDIERIGKVLKDFSEKNSLNLEEVHGSRLYFRVAYSNKIVFEIIPVVAVKNPKEAKNTTDLSYAHVKYVAGKIRKNKKLGVEIGIAKAFSKSCGVYGAESYVKGLSGYTIECLVIHYKSFLRMARELAKAKEQIVIDPEKHYKNKQEILISLNESKTRNPIVFVDPTWKERNVAAALSHETFSKFQRDLREFLKKPNIKFFERKEISEEELRKIADKKKAELVHLSLETNRQAGDIAGTKMKKFSEFIDFHLETKFDIMEKEFRYNGERSADVYYTVKPKKLALRKGPSVKMEKHAAAFKKMHKKTIVKNGILYAEEKAERSARDFLDNLIRKYQSVVEQMDITKAKIN